MEYTLQNDEPNESSIRICHESNQPFVTFYVTRGDQYDLLNSSSLGIDISKEQLHELIGTLLHVQSKMRK